jgi:hypothetical protein
MINSNSCLHELEYYLILTTKDERIQPIIFNVFFKVIASCKTNIIVPVKIGKVPSNSHPASVRTAPTRDALSSDLFVRLLQECALLPWLCTGTGAVVSRWFAPQCHNSHKTRVATNVSQLRHILCWMHSKGYCFALRVIYVWNLDKTTPIWCWRY